MRSQHRDLYRKILLRRALLPWAGEGAAYLPFCGDGDIASELYRERQIWGADIDPERVAICSRRLAGRIIVADCDAWPFPGCQARFCVADFDAYAYPYDSFRAWWSRARIGFPAVVFFTDGQLRAIMGNSDHWRSPDGAIQKKFGMLNRSPTIRAAYNFY